MVKRERRGERERWKNGYVEEIIKEPKAIFLAEDKHPKTSSRLRSLGTAFQFQQTVVCVSFFKHSAKGVTETSFHPTDTQKYIRCTHTHTLVTTNSPIYLL